MTFQIDEARFEYLRSHGYTEDSALGVLFVESLSDSDVLGGARDTSSSGFRQVMAFLGKDTNPGWIASQCAEAAYVRGLIGEREFDYLADR